MYVFSRKATTALSPGRESQEHNFSTKFRQPYFIDEWRVDLLAYIGGIVKEHKSTLLKAGGIEDHVHLLLRIHPEFANSKTVQLLKADSSKWINEQRKTPGRFDWLRGYGAFAVSKSMEGTVMNDVVNQLEHHTMQAFSDEYTGFLEKLGIGYDPQYVFE